MPGNSSKLDKPWSVTGKVGGHAVDSAQIRAIRLREQFIASSNEDYDAFVRLTTPDVARKTVDLTLGRIDIAMGLRTLGPAGDAILLTAVEKYLKEERPIVRQALGHIMDLPRRVGMNAEQVGRERSNAVVQPANREQSLKQAAAWICGASGTFRQEGNASTESVRAALDAFSRNASYVTRVGGLEEMNRQLVSADPNARTRRDIAPGGQIPCSVTGRWLLTKVAESVGAVPSDGDASRWTRLADFLLGGIIRAHGFADGNGRTARAAYAVCYIRAQLPVLPVPIAHERRLTGLSGL